MQFSSPRSPRFEMQFIKLGGFHYQLFSVSIRRAAFVYCAKERHSQSRDLKMLQHRGYAENCLCKHGNGLLWCQDFALPNIYGFQRFKCFCFNICTFAKSVYSPSITVLMIIKSFFSFLTRNLRSVHNKT